jgi:hypothetical protein
MEIKKMPDLRIGKAIIPVEGIKQLKDVKSLEDPNIKAQLMKDGLDEIVFQKGDKVFIAYKQNLDLSRLKLNLENFDENSAYDAGQLSQDGEAVKVLFTDDENKESFWTAPYADMGRAVTDLINDPIGKSALVGFIGGASAMVANKTGLSGVGIKSVYIGTGVGTVAAGLKAGSENGTCSDGTPGVIAGLGIGAVGYGVGSLAGLGGYHLVKAAIENPKVAILSTVSAATLVGTGIVLDLLSDNSKSVTYKVINKIAN